MAIEIIFVDMKRSRKEKSPWVKTKAKTGPKKKNSGEFGDEKKKILADTDKGSWFDQPSQIGEEKSGDEQCITSSKSVVGISRKKIMGTNLPEERRVIREPLPSTSQDYSSSSDSENFEDDEASSETWTIVHRKELNRVLEQSVSSGPISFC